MRNRIDNRFGERTNEIKQLVRGNRDPERYASVERWVRQCYHRPSQNALIMAALDEVLGGYGVEAIRDENSWDRYHGDIVATYVNMGASYADTVLYEVENDRFITTTWGDWVEEQGI